MSDDEPIDELLAKGTLTDAEMDEVMRSAPVLVRKLPDLRDLGVQDLSKNAANLPTLHVRLKAALEAGFHLEATALALLMMDFLLRIFVVNNRGVPIHAGERLMMGRLLGKAREAGMDSDLVARVEAFNTTRTKGIHGFLLGEITYDELGSAIRADPTLIEDLLLHVFASLPPG